MHCNLQGIHFTFVGHHPSLLVTVQHVWLCIIVIHCGGLVSWLWLSGCHGCIVVVAFTLQWYIVLLSIMGDDSGPQLLSIEVLL